MRVSHHHYQEARINDMQCTCSCKKFEEQKIPTATDYVAGYVVLTILGFCIIGYIIGVFLIIWEQLGFGGQNKVLMKSIKDRYGKK